MKNPNNININIKNPLLSPKIDTKMFPVESTNYQQRNRRRGRNDPNNRDYICPCGKSYLSYPALFTHIKTKHNGRVFRVFMYRHQARLLSQLHRIVEEEDQKLVRFMIVKVILRILLPMLWIDFVILLLASYLRNLKNHLDSNKY